MTPCARYGLTTGSIMLASMLLPAAFQPWFRGVGFNALDTYAALTQLLSLAWVVGAALRVPGLLALRNAYFERLPAHELRREVELHWMTIKTSLLSMVMILFLLGLQLLTRDIALLPAQAPSDVIASTLVFTLVGITGWQWFNRRALLPWRGHRSAKKSQCKTFSF